MGGEHKAEVWEGHGKEPRDSIENWESQRCDRLLKLGSTMLESRVHSTSQERLDKKCGRSQGGTECWKTSAHLSHCPCPGLLPDLGGGMFL